MTNQMPRFIADPVGAARARDQKQVRSTLKSGGNSRRGTFASFKNGFPQQYESQLERHYFEWLEINPNIIRYQAQPLKIRYRASGKVRHATPDVRIWTKASTFIVDVKPEAQLQKEQTRGKLLEVRNALQHLGHAYKVVSV